MCSMLPNNIEVLRENIQRETLLGTIQNISLRKDLILERKKEIRMIATLEVAVFAFHSNLMVIQRR